MDKCTLPRLFTALVRPHLEYDNTIWNPRFKLDEQAEKVQRRATKLVPSIRDLPYTERLRQVELPSVKHRRLRGDLIQVYKILNGIDRLDPTRFFTLATGTSATTRGHSQIIYKRNCKLGLRKNAFSYRIVNAWNSLPPPAVDATSLNAFKSQIDKHFIRVQYITPWCV